MGSTLFNYNELRYMYGAIERGRTRKEIRQGMRLLYNKGFRDSTLTAVRARYNEDRLAGIRLTQRGRDKSLQSVLMADISGSAASRNTWYEVQGKYKLLLDGKEIEKELRFHIQGPTERQIYAESDTIFNRMLRDSLEGATLLNTNYEALIQLE